MFVEDFIYVAVFEHDRDHIEQTIVAGIEAIPSSLASLTCRNARI